MKTLNIEVYGVFEVVKPPESTRTYGWTEHHEKRIGQIGSVEAYTDKLVLLSFERDLLNKPEFWTYTQEEAIKHNMLWLDRECLIPGYHTWMDPNQIDTIYIYDDGYGGRVFCTEVTINSQSSNENAEYVGRASQFIRRSTNNLVDTVRQYGVAPDNLWPRAIPIPWNLSFDKFQERPIAGTPEHYEPNDNPQRTMVIDPTIELTGVEALDKIAEIASKPELTKSDPVS